MLLVWGMVGISVAIDQSKDITEGLGTEQKYQVSERVVRQLLCYLPR